MSQTLADILRARLDIFVQMFKMVVNWTRIYLFTYQFPSIRKITEYFCFSLLLTPPLPCIPNNMLSLNLSVSIVHLFLWQFESSFCIVSLTVSSCNKPWKEENVKYRNSKFILNQGRKSLMLLTALKILLWSVISITTMHLPKSVCLKWANQAFHLCSSTSETENYVFYSLNSGQIQR